MIQNMGWGIFMMYAVLTYTGALFIFFCFPELKGRSIESMDDLFQRSLWTMWKHAYPTEAEKTRAGVQDKIDEKVVDADSIAQDGEKEIGRSDPKKIAVIHVESK